MKYGKFLPEKGTIGFVAPSFGCNIEPYKTAFDHSAEIWVQKGISRKALPVMMQRPAVTISYPARLPCILSEPVISLSL